MAIQHYLQDKSQHRFIVTWGDPKNGFSNGFIDINQGIPIGIMTSPSTSQPS